MNLRGGVALALALTALAACDTVPAAGQRPPIGGSVADDPAARRALTAAVTGLSAGAYHVTVASGDGGSASGAVDPVAGTANLTRHAAVEGTDVVEQAIRIRGAAWLRVDFAPINEQLGIPPTRWISVAPGKATVTAGGPFDLTGIDPYDVAGLLVEVTSVAYASPGRLVGVVDLSRSTGVSAPTADELSQAETAAVTTPFIATLDSRGRLLSLVIDAGRYNRDLSRTVTITAYGPVPGLGPPPAAQVVPATPLVYQLFTPDE